MKKTMKLLAIFAVILNVAAPYSSAQEKTPAATSVPQINAVIPELPKTPAAKNDEEIFKVPVEGTAAELAEYVSKLVAYRPQGINSQEAFVEFRGKFSAALKTAVDALLKKTDATDEQKEEAREWKLRAIIMGTIADDADKALTEIEAYRKELAAEKQDFQYAVQNAIFQIKLSRNVKTAIESGGSQADGFKKTLAEAKAFLEKEKFVPQYVMIAMFLIDIAERVDEGGKDGLQLLAIRELKPFLEKSDSPEAEEALTSLEGRFRFAKLSGSEIELECVLLDGKKLNIKDLRGKVVLIDFWATWCGPCLASVPVLTKLYEQYHDRGLEIIAYSVDEDINALKSFEEKSPHPWNVASVALSTKQKLTDYATYYGVTGIPTFVLVGKDGKVLSAIVGDVNAVAAKLGEIFPGEEKK
ncbi:MAG: TlpA family protein disulfide reductase [Planctomycetaceae bacterium]|jgi:thiol-disulfide isomerase/thioredoxin|nr:TlpA family protein disulfide reductase [Planctomycetaceae bacterium]